MPSWSKILIEIFTADGYQGHWEVTPPSKRGFFDDEDLIRIVMERIRKDERYGRASLRFLEEQDALVIGVFVDVEPPAAKHGAPYKPAESLQEPE